MPHTPQNAKLYYYTDWENSGWFGSADQFRKHFGSSSRTPLRVCCPDEILAPQGYTKTGHLANDPAERILTVKDFVRKLTP